MLQVLTVEISHVLYNHNLMESLKTLIGDVNLPHPKTIIMKQDTLKQFQLSYKEQSGEETKKKIESFHDLACPIKLCGAY